MAPKHKTSDAGNSDATERPMKCMHVQEKAVSMEFSTVVISGIHWGSENVDNRGLLYSIVNYSTVTVLDITSLEVTLFLSPSPILPTLYPYLSGKHQSVLCICEFRVFFRVHI